MTPIAFNLTPRLRACLPGDTRHSTLLALYEALQEAAVFEMAQPAPASNEPVPDAEGWIEWGGGECPVDDSTMIECKFDTAPYGPETDLAGGWRWDKVNGWRNIIAYRVVKS